VCWCSFVVWLGWCGIRMQAEACIWIPHQPSQTTKEHQHTSNQSNITHEITHQISRKLLKMDVLTSETCLALNNEIITQVTQSLSLFIQLSVLIGLGVDSADLTPVKMSALTHN